MARVIQAVQIFKKVEDVTAAKDEPSPVYLMDELAEMARGSAEASEKISDRIAKRLQNKSPVVKFKALRLIRHIVNKGCGQFQRAMQRHAAIVREHLHFKGDMDAYKGDTLNQRVRDAAKEASDSLFNTVVAQPVSNLSSRIQGFGSSATLPHTSSQGNLAGGGGGGGGGGVGSKSGSTSSNSRMVGLGGSSYTAPTAVSNGNGAAAGGFGGFGGPAKGVNRPLTGGYGNDTTSGHGSSGSHEGGYSAPAVTAVEVLGSEDQLVESICTPGGLRLAPDPDDLRRFVEAVGNLDGLKVAELLRDKMDGSGPWQQLLRSLYALEAVLLQGSSQACGEIAVLFQSDPEPLQAAAGHTQAAVRERAGRVLKLLLGDSNTGAKARAPVPQPAGSTQTLRPQPAADLLGGLDMLGSPVHSAQPPQQQLLQPAQPPAANSGAGDIFSGLAVPAPSAGSPQACPAASAIPIPGPGVHPAYGQQHQPQQPYQHQPQQPYQLCPAAGPAAPALRPAVDPFDLLSAPLSTPLSTPANSSNAQPQRPLPQHPQPQHPQRPSQDPPNQNVGSGGAGVAGGMMPPAGSSSNGPAAGHAAPPRGAGAPLDDMFADMSLAGPAGQRAGGATGISAANPFGTGPGDAYGASGTAYGSAASYNNVHSCIAPPGGTGAAPRPMGQQALPSSSSSGMGAPMAGMGSHDSYYGGTQQGVLGYGSAAAQQGSSMRASAAPGGNLLSGFGAQSSGAPGWGPLGPPGAAPWPTGVGAAGYGGPGGLAGSGTGVGMGVSGVSAPASGVGMGTAVGNTAGGSMMVGPGGQVRYVGGPAQGAMAASAATGPGPAAQQYGGQGAMAAGGGMGMAIGPQPQPHGGQGQGGWHQGYTPQHPMGGVQQQHAAGVSQYQPQQRGAANFDFVLDEFK